MNDKKKTFERIMKETFRFRDRKRAFDFAARCIKPHHVMLGDYPEYWVTTPANAARLQRMGYEYAK